MTLHISKPEPGFFQMRRVRGGVWVPVVVYRPCPIEPETFQWVDRWYHLRCLIDGREDGDLEQIWPYLRPIEEKEYLFLVASHDWARTYEPHAPEANPRRPVDLDAMAPIYSRLGEQ